MELSVTFSMPPESTVEQCAGVLCNFAEGVSRQANELGAAWVKMTMTLPEELEPKLLAAKEAYDEAHATPLRLVIDNTR